MFTPHGGAWATRADEELWRGWMPRLELTGSRELTLTYMSPQIVLGNTVYTPSVTNLSNCLVTDNLVLPDGSDAGAAPAASSLYYAYACTVGAFAGRVALSTTFPSLGDFGWALNNLGDGALCQFVGWVGTNASPNFDDSPKSRLVVSFAHRRPKSLLALAPAYNNNNAQTTFVANSAVWAPLAANFKVDYVSNGEDAVGLELVVVTGGAAAAEAAFGIGENSTTAPMSAAVLANGAVSGTSVTVPGFYDPQNSLWFGAVGTLRSAHALGMTGGSALTLRADLARNGAASDPPATMLRGWLMG